MNTKKITPVVVSTTNMSTHIITSITAAAIMNIIPTSITNTSVATNIRSIPAPAGITPTTRRNTLFPAAVVMLIITNMTTTMITGVPVATIMIMATMTAAAAVDMITMTTTTAPAAAVMTIIMRIPRRRSVS